MKISLINGSPKAKNSATSLILKELQNLLSPEYEISNLHFGKKQISVDELQTLTDCDVMVFAYPLYVDSLPSHLLSCLVQLEKYLKDAEDIHPCTVYAMVNCGFYEGRQNALALDIMKCWCKKAGLTWGGGLGIGGGGMLPMINNIPSGKGPKKNFSSALNKLTERISHLESGENICFSPNFPRLLYKMAAEAGWRQAVKMNGLSKQALWNKKV